MVYELLQRCGNGELHRVQVWRRERVGIRVPCLAAARCWAEGGLDEWVKGGPGGWRPEGR